MSVWWEKTGKSTLVWLSVLLFVLGALPVLYGLAALLLLGSTD